MAGHGGGDSGVQNRRADSKAPRGGRRRRARRRRFAAAMGRHRKIQRTTRNAAHGEPLKRDGDTARERPRRPPAVKQPWLARLGLAAVARAARSRRERPSGCHPRPDAVQGSTRGRVWRTTHPRPRRARSRVRWAGGRGARPSHARRRSGGASPGRGPALSTLGPPLVADGSRPLIARRRNAPVPRRRRWTREASAWPDFLHRRQAGGF